MSMLMSLLSPLSLLAQTQVSEAPERQIWIGIVIAGVLGVAVVALNLKGSKRGHQD
jgi:hypothetical protein